MYGVTWEYGMERAFTTVVVMARTKCAYYQFKALAFLAAVSSVG